MTGARRYQIENLALHLPEAIRDLIWELLDALQEAESGYWPEMNRMRENHERMHQRAQRAEAIIMRLRTDGLEALPYPVGLCDMKRGPCSCGAWH